MVRKKRSAASAANGESESNGTRVVDPAKVRSFMESKSLSMEATAEALHVSVHTVERMLTGQPVRPRTVIDVAANMAIPVAELLLNGSDSKNGLLAHSEWDVLEQVSDWAPVSAGIQCRIHRLRHRFLPETYARRKCYRIKNLAGREEKQLREYFLRHPKIVRRLRNSPYFPANHSVFSECDEKTWWIIDEWTAGHTLQAAVSIGPLAGEDLPAVMLQVAEALQTLHRAVIICRCLSPASIVIREKGTIVLTDLELSKLSDGSATVRDHVRRGAPYQAPEVGNPDRELDLSVDAYSWARIFVHAASGQLPAAGAEGNLIERLSLPSEVKRLVSRCLAQDHRERPKSMDEIIFALKRNF